MHKCFRATSKMSLCLTNRILDVRFMGLNSENGDNKSYITNENISNRPVYTPETPASIDEPPTTCCMSGCSNCVYIIWAEALSKQMANADPEIANKILENVQDPGMQAFLKMELRNLRIIK